MVAKVKGFTFWLTYWDVAQELTPKQQGEFYRAIADYMFTDTDPEDGLKGSVRIAFKAIKANLKTSIKRAEVGSEGGRQSASKRQANGNQSASKAEAKSKQVKGQDKDKDKDKGKNPEPPRATQMPQAVRDELERLHLVK